MSELNVLQSVTKILTGGVIGQIVGFFSLPVIAKLYGPEVIGKYGIYLSLISVFSIIFTFRFDFFINSRSDIKDSENVLDIAIYSAFVFLVFGYIVVYLIDIFSISNFVFLYLLPIGVFFSSVFQAYTFYRIRLGNFGTIAFSKGFFAILISLLQLIFAIYIKTDSSIIFAYIIGQIFSIIILFSGSYKISPPNKSHATLIFSILRPASVLVLSGVINATASTIPIVMIGNKFGVATAGWLALSQRLFATPLDLFGTSIAQVFTGNIGDPSLPYGIKLRLFKKLTLTVIFIGFIFFILALIIKFFSTQLLGNEWMGVSTIVMPISIIYIFRLFGNTFAQASVIGRREWGILAIDLMRAICIFYLFLHTDFSLTITMISYSIVMAVFYVLQYVLAYSSLMRGFTDEIRRM